MFNLNVASLIPEAVRRKVIDSAIDLVSDQAEKLLGHKAAKTIRGLHSAASFRASFDAGLQRAVKRFFEEYQVEDEDLVEALGKDKSFFQNQEVQRALLQILRQPDVYLENEQAVVVGSFKHILPDRLNRDRVDRAVSRFLIYLAQEVWNLPELRDTYQGLYAKGTYESSRELVSLQKAQLGLQQEQLILQQESLRALGELPDTLRETMLQLTVAIEQQKLPIGGAVRLLPAPKRVYQNLPRPDYERFVGRQKELAEVNRLLLPETRHFSVCIDGIGGVGKSALALEAAYHYLKQYDSLPDEQRFEAIIWVSAKEKMLTGEGITTRSQALRTLEDLHTTIAITLNREDIRRAKSQEQDELVRQALSHQRTLLIIDNLDTIDDERVLNFIRDLPAPTKVILTTRHWRDISYPVRLAELKESDGFTLIADEASKKGVALGDDHVRRLYQATSGLPLALVWSVALMGFDQDIDHVLARFSAPDSDLTRFCYEGSVERIRDKPAHKLLMALALFVTDASREALGQVADVAEPDRRDGLAELEKLSLVNRDGGRFRALALTMIYSRVELAKKPELEASYRDRWVYLWLTLLGAPRQTHYERLDQVRLEFRNILAAMDFCWVTGKVETLIDLVWRLEFYFRMTGNWLAWNTYTELALEVAPSLGAERGALAQANLSYSLAMLRTSQGDGDVAEHLLNNAIKMYRLHKDKEGTALALWWLGSIQSDRKGLAVARATQNKALRIARQLKHQVLIDRIERQLGLIDAAEGNFASAEKRILKASASFNQPSHSLILTCISLGQISLQKPEQDFDAAKGYFQQAFEISQRLNIPAGLATAQLYLAEVEWKIGHSALARKLAKAAMEGFTILGMKQDIIQTQALLEQMVAQQGAVTAGTE